MAKNTIKKAKRDKNFAVMSNYHLRDRRLSLKAKGLLSQMLSLPTDWDYSIAGLAAINQESVTAVRTAMKELVEMGYVTRSQTRDENGQLGHNEYVINEIPTNLVEEKAITATRSSVKRCTSSKAVSSVLPSADLPLSENPLTDNPPQLNKEIPSKEKQNIDYISQSINRMEIPNIDENLIDGYDRKTNISYFDTIEYVRENIEYDIYVSNNPTEKEYVDEIVELVAETICVTPQSGTYLINRSSYPAEVVKGRLLKLNYSHIEYAISCIKATTTKIRNIKNYLLTVLFNAPITIEHYYRSLVNHDFYGLAMN